MIGAFKAKTHLSELLERVRRGERITITKHGTPVAVLVPPEAEVIVPANWPAEMANVLLMAERRGRTRPGDAEAALDAIGRLPIRIDIGATSSRLLRAARASRLSAYDAAYLELALREGVPLATFDRQLAAAARKSGVELLI